MHAINRPEVIVASVDEKIDEKGNLVDEKTRKKIRQLLENLVDWTKKLERE
jgi:molecular chaperone DnaK (HSP70)